MALMAKNDHLTIDEVLGLYSLRLCQTPCYKELVAN